MFTKMIKSGVLVLTLFTILGTNASKSWAGPGYYYSIYPNQSLNSNSNGGGGFTRSFSTNSGVPFLYFQVSHAVNSAGIAIENLGFYNPLSSDPRVNIIMYTPLKNIKSLILLCNSPAPAGGGNAYYYVGAGQNCTVDSVGTIE